MRCAHFQAGVASSLDTKHSFITGGATSIQYDKVLGPEFHQLLGRVNVML